MSEVVAKYYAQLTQAGKKKRVTFSVDEALLERARSRSVQNTEWVRC